MIFFFFFVCVYMQVMKNNYSEFVLDFGREKTKYQKYILDFKARILIWKGLYGQPMMLR